MCLTRYFLDSGGYGGGGYQQGGYGGQGYSSGGYGGGGGKFHLFFIYFCGMVTLLCRRIPRRRRRRKLLVLTPAIGDHLHRTAYMSLFPLLLFLLSLSSLEGSRTNQYLHNALSVSGVSLGFTSAIDMYSPPDVL